MKDLPKTVAAVVTTFVVTLALGVIQGYVQRDTGRITIGPPLRMNQAIYLPIDVFNYESDPVDDLQLEIPSSTPISQIVLSSTILVREAESLVEAEGLRRISLSNIIGNAITRLWVPLTSAADIERVRVINSRSKRLVLEKVNDLRHPIGQSIINAIPTSIVYSILMAVFFVWFFSMKRDAAELRLDLDKIKAEDQNLRSRLEAIQKESTERYARLRILLLARVSDYAKELDFWRDTIRKILWENSKGMEKADRLIELVTQNLRTYSTRGYKLEYEAIKAAAALFPKEELSAPASDDRK